MSEKTTHGSARAHLDVVQRDVDRAFDRVVAGLGKEYDASDLARVAACIRLHSHLKVALLMVLEK